MKDAPEPASGASFAKVIKPCGAHRDRALTRQARQLGFAGVSLKASEIFFLRGETDTANLRFIVPRLLDDGRAAGCRGRPGQPGPASRRERRRDRRRPAGWVMWGEGWGSVPWGSLLDELVAVPVPLMTGPIVGHLACSIPAVDALSCSMPASDTLACVVVDTWTFPPVCFTR